METQTNNAQIPQKIRNCRRWTEKEKEFVKKNYASMTVQQISKKIDRAPKAVRTQIERMGIKLNILSRNIPKPKSIPKKQNKGWSIDTYGRKLIRINKRYVAEHRLIIEQSIGRKLKREEQVHHINCDKTDNTIQNLYLFSNASKHQNSHHSIEKLVKELLERKIIKFNQKTGNYEINKEGKDVDSGRGA